MNKIILAALTCIAISASPLLAQAPTSEEQAACRSDAIKICSEQIGKPPEMRACLVKNKARLSLSCLKVIEARGG